MMEDIQNAINSLEITLIRHGNTGLIEDIFSIKTVKQAIKALEKQIPKLVDKNLHNVAFCPSCNGSVWQISDDSKYCFRCGQKLDWD